MYPKSLPLVKSEEEGSSNGNDFILVDMPWPTFNYYIMVLFKRMSIP